MARLLRWSRFVPLAVAICNAAVGMAASGLSYSALLTGSKGVNINAAAADRQGNVYVVGATQSPDFPVTSTALKPQIDPNGDAFVAKFSPTGQLLWSTFYGGMYGASANAVAVDGSGNVVVAGDTYSPDFPVVNAYEPVFNNGVTQPVGQEDAFVFKLDPTGTKILYSTFLGSFTSGTSLALDSFGAAYVTGTLNAHDAHPFPVFTNYDGQSGTYVAKLDAAGKFSYAYYDPYYANVLVPQGIAVDSSGSAYVSTLDAQVDTTIFKLSPAGASLVYRTTLGTSVPTALAVDSAGSAYVTGVTAAIGYPLVNALETSFGARPLWKTANAGAAWNPLENPPFQVASVVAVNPSNPQIIYAGTNSGLFVSADAGVTWTASGAGVVPAQVDALAIDPADPQILYAGSTEGLGVDRSRDGGATWTEVQTGHQGIDQLAVDAQNPANVYAVDGAQNLMRSADSGVSWSTVLTGVGNIALDPRVSGSVWAYIPAPISTFPIGLAVGPRPAASAPVSMLMHSADGGVTWKQIPGVQPNLEVVVDGSTNPSTIYAGTAARSTNGGATWQPMTRPNAFATTALAADPLTGTLYAAQSCAIFSSGDRGQMWSAIGSPDPVNDGNCPSVFGLFPAGTAGALYALTARIQTVAFVTKLSPDGSTILYSTYLDGHQSMLPTPSGTNYASQNEGTAIGIDASGDAVVAGWTRSTDFPTVNAAQAANAGGADAFVAVISPGGERLTYATYLGGSQDDVATALAIDPQGNLIVAGETLSGDFPGASGSAPAVAIGFAAKLTIPAPVITEVVSAASFQAPIESGSWVMIQGTELADTTRLWQTSDFNGNNLPTQLDGVSVTIDGIPAYVEYISSTQINVLAPADPSTGTVNVVVTNNGSVSAPATAQLQSVAPAFFMSPTYNVYASVIPGYIPVTASAPAMPGDLVVLWCTGFGPTNPPTSAGTVVTGAPATLATPAVIVGGMQVPVVSSVMTPGTVGLYQITIRLPANVPTGTPSIQASIGGAQTQSGVTLFVAPAAGAPTITLQSSLSAATLGQSVTLTATVLPAAAGGKVTFLDGVNLVGIGPLAKGQATLQTSLLAAGTHAITALYGASESAPVSIAVHALADSGFQTVQTALTLRGLNGLTVADFNGDGIPDVAVVDALYGGQSPLVLVSLNVLLGNGDGTFRVSAQIGLNEVVTLRPAIADFNGDGIPDIATSDGVYLGNGDGTFKSAVPINLDFDGPLVSLVAGDFNGDGKADLAWSGWVDGASGGTVGVLPGKGDGTFGPSTNTNVANGGALAIGDFNHDGLADLAVTQGANSTVQAVTILLGKGDGTFQTPAPYSLSYSTNTIAVADFNGDGRDDVVAGGLGGFLSVFLSNPDGTLQSPATIPLSTVLSGLAVGDFNGDGHADVAYTSSTGTYILPGNGDGTLQSPAAEPGAFLGAIAAGDFNGDGRTDLIGLFANTQGTGVQVLLGQAATGVTGTMQVDRK